MNYAGIRMEIVTSDKCPEWSLTRAALLLGHSSLLLSCPLEHMMEAKPAWTCKCCTFIKQEAATEGKLLP